MDLCGTVHVPNGLTDIVYMTEGYSLKAPPLNVECHRINRRQWKSRKIDYPLFPQIESDLKPASVPNGTLRLPHSYHNPLEEEQKGSPLMPRMPPRHTPGPSDVRTQAAFDRPVSLCEYSDPSSCRKAKNASKQRPGALKERSISLANDSSQTASGGSSTVSFRISSPQTTDRVMKQWRHVSGFHRV